MYRVLIADDSEFIRSSLRAIRERSGWEVVGEAADCPGAVAKCRRLRPDEVTAEITAVMAGRLWSDTSDMSGQGG